MTNNDFNLHEGERITIFEEKLFKKKGERITNIFENPKSIKIYEIINMIFSLFMIYIICRSLNIYFRNELISTENEITTSIVIYCIIFYLILSLNNSNIKVNSKEIYYYDKFLIIREKLNNPEIYIDQKLLFNSIDRFLINNKGLLEIIIKDNVIETNILEQQVIVVEDSSNRGYTGKSGLLIDQLKTLKLEKKYKNKKDELIGFLNRKIK